ncbi:hypothetical protein HPB49_004184 [Dermacentor silvarum]|uniref:Uncharacterized protein n=1 Tax=Dermacentor silvarum TaxID=543639 RepID=A0ACB8DMX2_DERSI|nr:hypothetical protein HPB49_004184 [Dermacentor silvarum]
MFDFQDMVSNPVMNRSTRSRASYTQSYLAPLTGPGCSTVLTLWQKKAIAKEKTKPPEYSRTLKHQEASAGQATGKSKRKPASRRFPPLPKDDFKIVVRPHQGLPVKNLTSPLLADAVIAACGRQISGEQFLLRIQPGSNIFIVSTPHQTVADYVRRIQTLSINGRPHSVNAYVATSHGTVTSGNVIRNIVDTHAQAWSACVEIHLLPAIKRSFVSCCSAVYMVSEVGSAKYFSLFLTGSPNSFQDCDPELDIFEEGISKFDGRYQIPLMMQAPGIVELE